LLVDGWIRRSIVPPQRRNMAGVRPVVVESSKRIEKAAGTLIHNKRQPRRLRNA